MQVHSAKLSHDMLTCLSRHHSAGHEVYGTSCLASDTGRPAEHAIIDALVH